MPKPNAPAKPKVVDKPRGTDDGWVEQPTGRKAQRKAKREAAQALEAAVSAAAVKDGQAAAIAEDEDMPEPLEPSVLQQLETAKQRAHELDAIGDAARAAIPGFSVLLEAAKAHRDGLQKERKAARPVRWRLVEAQGCAKAKADALEKAQVRLASSRADLEACQLACQLAEADLEKSTVALCEADAAVARVLAEVADAAKPSVAQADDATVAATANVLVQQLGALSTAVASNNTDAAIAAIQHQCARLLTFMPGIQRFPMGPQQAVPMAPAPVAPPVPNAPVAPAPVTAVPINHDGVSPMVATLAAPAPAAQPSVAPVLHAAVNPPRGNGRRGTSPPPIDDSDLDDVDCIDRDGSRSRTPDRPTPAESAAVAQTRRLEDMGFVTTATADPYGAVPAHVGAHYG